MEERTQFPKQEILDRLKEVLDRIPNTAITGIREEVRGDSRQVDMECTVQLPAGQVELLIEYKAEGSPSIIRRTASQLRAYQKAYSKSNVCVVFSAPFISEEGFEVCREEGIGGLDTAGNCLLSLPGQYIEIIGRKNPRPMKRPIKSLYSPKSSRIIRVLLFDVGKWWQVQELAEEAKISLGLASKVKQLLLAEEFVLENERRVRVKSPRRLLESWAENYRYKRNQVKEYYSLDGDPAFIEKISDYCAARDVRYALGLFSSASRYAPHVRMNKAFVFIDADLDAVARDLNLKPVSSGSNVMLLRPYDTGVFYNASVVDGLMVVSDIQTYIDVKSYKGRGEEAAAFLMDNVLEKKWRSARSMDDAK